MTISGRRSFLGGAASVALSGCGGGGGSSGGAPAATLSNPQPTPGGPTAAATLAVTGASAGAVGAGFAGLSYEKALVSEPLFQSTNANLVGLFKALGPSLLRIGGATVDQTVWNPTGPGLTSVANGWVVSPPDVDRLAAFAAATGWKVLYGVNLATSTPGVAAAEAAYAAKALGANLYGIEIGNEPDNYAPFSSYAPPAGFTSWTLQAFESQWSLFRTAILNTTPGLAVTGPACGNSVTTWTGPFAASYGKDISLLTQHYYRSSGTATTDTPTTLVTADPVLQGELVNLQGYAQQAAIPYRMAEMNSYYAGGAGGGNDLAAALWLIDSLFAIALHGGLGANFHGGGDQSGISPIADNDGAVAAIQADYYGMLFFTQAGQGTLLQTSLSAGGLNATGYALKTAAGMSLMVLNKDPTQALSLALSLPGPASAATLILIWAWSRLRFCGRG